MKRTDYLLLAIMLLFSGIAIFFFTATPSPLVIEWFYKE